MEIITKNYRETFEFGEKIGLGLKSGKIFALSGDLGAGKTVFVQGLAKGLGIKNKIVSPTFILMRSYKGRLNLLHLDLYRLEGDIKRQVEDLGLFDMWKDMQNVVAIEWAEKISKACGPLAVKDSLPKDTVWVKFKNLDQERRKIEVNGIQCESFEES